MRDKRDYHFCDQVRQSRANGALQRVILAIIGLASLLYTLCSTTPAFRTKHVGDYHVLADQKSDETDFDWTSLSPSRDLEYVPCYGRFECARLLLPMDWTAPEDEWLGHEVAIAMIRQPANVSVTDPRYGGAVYINPGGPGAQGITTVTGRLNGHLTHAINGDNTDEKVFDIVSFDPRGVGFSTPVISCFDDLVSRQLWHQLGATYGNIDSSERSFDMHWARAKSLEQLCHVSNVSGRGLAMSTVTTPFVARDMLAMVEKSGEERERRARAVVGRDQELPDSLRYKPGNELLQYWGFSYGAFLGGTFASLYPDRVGRMIVDGCGDWVDNTSGEFRGFLLDTDKEWSEFFKLCHAAGPIPYKDGAWIKLAQTLSELLSGNITAGVADMLPSRKFRTSTAGCRTPDCVTEGMGEGFWSEVNYGIYCPDGQDFRNLSKSEMRTWFDGIRDQSPLFGGAFATTSKMPCVGYPVRPKWRFEGPFGGKTKTPMLFVGNTLDPVAPIAGTRMNVPLFEGAGFLQQDSVGHCSVAAPSNCTVSYIRSYLVSGILPDGGTVCPVDRLPFDD
ncbi:Tripeptidyl aminopeptidase [Colletotrichum orbiculare MAFF 240422]|uniref:Tripeptidyl aminopeptidase n=1 Tax=Colletotrichum orbiculare (strain 104-T / ATCC 96160 / CBS 514.97 / LARS 414 / MAFF 240422) TaxID=1213857 RepID=A0A484FHK6_COLOR|nr:Tripeptidyl aminopeptidase [Colletotrichum orbiculare MAFF 240422]